MKIYINAPNENWILDRYKTEWNAYNPEYATTDIDSYNVTSNQILEWINMKIPEQKKKITLKKECLLLWVMTL